VDASSESGSPSTLKRLLALTAAATLWAGALVEIPADASRAAHRPAGVPRSCPPRSMLRTALHLNITRVTSFVGEISSTTLPGMGPAPASAHYVKTGQNERTCTYTGSPAGPITVSFVSPVTARAFTRSRTSLRKSGVAVVLVVGLGDSAWAARAGGLLFVLEGGLEIVISAPRTSGADLKVLANQLV
jgi:hypothetical protein